MTYSDLKVSIIIPVYNEEKNIAPLTKKLNKNLSRLSLKAFEIIFVDDGSADKTFENILIEKNKYNFINVIKLRKNFGKSLAYSIGFSHAKFDVIITMDGDLQDDPSEIAMFLEKIDEGYDLVNGWKTKGKGTVGKTIASYIFNKVVAFTFGLKLHDFNCPFKAYRKKIIEGLTLYGGLYRYIPIFASNYGYKISEIKISNLPRLNGRSKYGGKRFISGFYDYLTAIFLIKFNQKPMHLFGSLALFCMILGTIILSYFAWLSINGEKVGSRPMFLLGILLEIVSLQFFSIGFIGDMFTRSIVNVDQEYLVEKTA